MTMVELKDWLFIKTHSMLHPTLVYGVEGTRLQVQRTCKQLSMRFGEPTTSSSLGPIPQKVNDKSSFVGLS